MRIFACIDLCCSVKWKSRPWVEACITQPCFLSQVVYIVFLETAYQDDSIMKPDPHCAYRQPASSYLFGENHSDIATEHGNTQLRT